MIKFLTEQSFLFVLYWVPSIIYQNLKPSAFRRFQNQLLTLSWTLQKGELRVPREVICLVLLNGRAPALIAVAGALSMGKGR